MAGETESTTPESVDVAGAVALMSDLAKDVGEEEKGERDVDTAADGDDAAVAEADEEAGEGEEPEEVAEDEVPAEGSDAPEFWSAADKAAWNSVPAELRPVLKKYEQQRVEFVNEKAREAATIRARAAEEVQRANAVVDQAAQWWRQAGPAHGVANGADDVEGRRPRKTTTPPAETSTNVGLDMTPMWVQSA